VVNEAPDAAAEALPVSPETRAKILAEVNKYPRKRGAMLPTLHLVHSELGWISPEMARSLAVFFEIQPVEVMEVVAFYNMFFDRPQGRHHVRVCTNLPCSLRGARSLLAQIEALLGVRSGETTPDGRITLGHEECLGACAYAPMLRVDDVYHEDLDLEKALRILEELE
jgi:NADH-quinone oxidoreductase subunit E